MKIVSKGEQIEALQDLQASENSKGNISSYIKTFLFLAVVIGSIIYQNIDLSNAFSKLNDIAFIFFIILLVLFLLVELIQVPIISILMKHFNINMPFNDIYSINLISQFYSLTPLSGLAGGFVRWYRFGKKDNKHSEVFTAIVVQKVLFILSILCFGIVILIIKNPFVNNDSLYNLMIVLSVILLIGVLVSLYILTHQKIMTLLSYFLVRPTLKTLPGIIASPFKKVWASIKQYRGAYKPLFLSFTFAILYQVAAFGLFFVVLHVINVEIAVINAAVLYFFFKGSMEILPIMSIFTLFLFDNDIFGPFKIPGEEAIVYSLIMASFYFLIGGVFELIEKLSSKKKIN